MKLRLDDEPLLAVDDIQGDSLRGFDTRNLVLLGFRFGDLDRARDLLRTVEPASLRRVHGFRMRRSAGDGTTEVELLSNVALSAEGLRALGFNPREIADGYFQKAMGALADDYGDPLSGGSPADYVTGQTQASTPHVLFLLGCMSDSQAAQATQEFLVRAEAAGLSLIHRQPGQLLPRRTEHFGFRDGISSPGPRGRLASDPAEPLTPRYLADDEPDSDLFGRPGQPLVWPGHYVFGYPTQADDDPRRALPPREAPAWARNGSLLMYRRLRQRVDVFRAAVETMAQNLTAGFGRPFAAGQVAAMIVGRFEDGTPIALAGAPDPALSGDDMRVNAFAYGGGAPLTVVDGDARTTLPAYADDSRGLRCPMFAHVRKVNPRDQRTDRGSPTLTSTFQMLRRGIPFGRPFDEDPKGERGLLFLSYQTSVEDQFQVLNRGWMNNPDAPESGIDGHDLLVGQCSGGQPRRATVRDAAENAVTLTLPDRFVVPTGGGVFFVPAVSFLRQL